MAWQRVTCKTGYSMRVREARAGKSIYPQVHNVALNTGARKTEPNEWCVNRQACEGGVVVILN